MQGFGRICRFVRQRQTQLFVTVVAPSAVALLETRRLEHNLILALQIGREQFGQLAPSLQTLFGLYQRRRVRRATCLPVVHTTATQD